MMSVHSFDTKGLKVWHHRGDETKNPRIVVVHGLCEHSARHLNTINQLTATGYECFRFDLRGHGESEGKRQWIDSFDDYVNDVATVFEWIDNEFPYKPVFLHGHSLGGAICLRFTARYQHRLRGVFVNAPAYKIGAGVSPFKVFLAKTVNRVLPRLSMKNNLDINAISRDPQVIANSQNDPLVCDFNTVRQGYEILNALPTMADAVRKITIPILFTHGEQDRLSLAEGSAELCELCASNDKEYTCLPGVYHEPHNDIDKDLYFQKILSWLERHE